MIRCLSTQFAKEKTQTVNIFSDWAKNVVDEEKCISPNFSEIDYFINTFALKDFNHLSFKFGTLMNDVLDVDESSSNEQNFAILKARRVYQLLTGVANESFGKAELHL